MRIHFVCILLCLHQWVSAQTDKVYLKNGSTLRGRITQGAPTDTLLLHIEGSVFSVPLGLVEEIRYQKRNGIRPEKYSALTYPKTFATTLEAGVLLGSHADEHLKLRTSLDLTQEYHHHPLLNGGLGIGIQSYHMYRVLPFTLNYQGLFGRRRKSIFVGGRVGYGFVQRRLQLENIHISGGMHYQVGLGWQHQIGTNAFRIKIGYSTQAVQEKQELSPYYYITKERRMNRLSISVAYVLKY